MNWNIRDTDFDAKIMEERVSMCPESHKAGLRSALNYLYGPTRTIDKDRVVQAELYLTDAEKKVIRWLHTRTNGNLRSKYGERAIQAAKEARYKCSTCGYDDVRALELDHVEGQREEIGSHTFACLCANCHNIKSFQKDWTGKKAG